MTTGPINPPVISRWRTIWMTIKLIFGFKHMSMVELLLGLAKRQSLVFRLSNRRKDYIVHDPEVIREILQGQTDVFTKKQESGCRTLGKLLGNGLLTIADDELWKKHRKVIHPYVSLQKMPRMLAITQTYVAELCQRWDHFAEYNEAFDVGKEFQALSLQISMKNLFSEDISYKEALNITRDLSYCSDCANRSAIYAPWVPLPNNQWLHYLRRKIDRRCLQMIARRRASQTWPDDLLSAMLKTQTEPGECVLSDDDILAQIKTFMATGYKTTGDSLTWLWYVLGKNPEVKVKIAQEVHKLIEDNQFDYEGLNQLTYLRQVIDENLRMYPVIWSYGRMTEKAVVAGKYQFPEKATVIVCPFLLHRHPEFWHNPEVFDPKNFSPENKAKRHKLSYLPFGLGARTCIGNLTAIQQMLSVTAQLTVRYHWRLMPESRNPGYHTQITLRPRAPIRIKLKKFKLNVE